MAPLLCNGIYKIQNAQFTDLVADLINGNPHGPILAVKKRASNRNDKWRLVNIPFAGNSVTLESVSTPGTFADAQQFQGSDLVGSPTKTEWILLDESNGKYAIQTENGVYVWELPQPGKEFENIQLVQHTGQLNTRWYFERIGNCE